MRRTSPGIRRWVAACAAALAGCGTVAGLAPATVEVLAEQRWHWVASLESGVVTDRPDPARYWIEIARPGAVVVQADCNSGVARRPDPDRFAVGPVALTRRACESGSLDTRFAQLVGAVRTASMDGRLLRLHAGPVDLLFTRDARARLAAYDCASGRREALFEPGFAHLVEGGASLHLTQAGDAYEGDGLRLEVGAAGMRLSGASQAGSGFCRRAGA